MDTVTCIEFPKSFVDALASMQKESELGLTLFHSINMEKLQHENQRQYRAGSPDNGLGHVIRPPNHHGLEFRTRALRVASTAL